MKLSKQELMQRITDSIKDNDELVLSLLEDIEDSVDESADTALLESEKKKREEIELKYNDLKEKYKERFLNNDNRKEEPEDKKEGLEEKEIIDIKEI